MDSSTGAFLLSADRMAPALCREKFGQQFCYLWTFTNPDLVPIKTTTARWNRFANYLRRKFSDKPFLRVFEMHDTHGMHVHMLVPFRLDVNELRKYANKSGFGRIHAKVIRAEIGFRYLAKYLTKGRGKKRPACLKGVRLWAATNFPDHSLAKNIKTYNFCSSIYKNSMDHVDRSVNDFLLSINDTDLLDRLHQSTGHSRFCALNDFCNAHYWAFYYFLSETQSDRILAGYRLLRLNTL